jgi:hypothetical protein
MAPGLFSAAQDSPLLASVGGQIDPGETLRLTLPDAGAPGVVYGQVTESDGVTPLSNTQFSLFFTGLYGSVQRNVATNTSGRFVLRAVQPGGVFALLDAGDAGVQGGGATGLLSSGSALRLDLRRGRFGAVQLPTTRNAFRVVGALALQLRRRVDYRTPNDQVLSVNGMPYPEFSAAHPLEDGARLEMYPVTMAGAMVERRVFSPPGANWLRYLEILSNPGDTPLELFVRVRGNVVGPASLTSSGDTRQCTRPAARVRLRRHGRHRRGLASRLRDRRALPESAAAIHVRLATHPRARHERGLHALRRQG